MTANKAAQDFDMYSVSSFDTTKVCVVSVFLSNMADNMYLRDWRRFNNSGSRESQQVSDQVGHTDNTASDRYHCLGITSVLDPSHFTQVGMDG